jgi:hypothetical protein
MDQQWRFSLLPSQVARSPVTEAMAECAISSFKRAGEDQGPDHVFSFSFDVLCANFQDQVVIFQILKVMFVICTSTSTAWY